MATKGESEEEAGKEGGAEGRRAWKRRWRQKDAMPFRRARLLHRVFRRIIIISDSKAVLTFRHHGHFKVRKHRKSIETQREVTQTPDVERKLHLEFASLQLC
jgi:hypothetical protein